MEEVFKYDNYIFDLYGTLIDIWTDEWDIKTWKKWARDLKKAGIKHPFLRKFRKEFFSLDKEYRAKRTDCEYPEIDILEVYDELFTKYGNKKMSKEQLFEISFKFREASYKRIGLFEGVPEFLKKLKEEGKNVYILSNAQRSYTLYEITGFELDKMVDDYLISSDFGYMKPEKKFFDAIVNKHNLDKEKTVMIGDSKQNDYEGALNYGLNGIWLNGENSADKFYKRYM